MVGMWRMKIPELDFVHDVINVMFKESRDSTTFNSPFGSKRAPNGGIEYTIELTLIITNPSNVPSVLGERFTLLLKQINGDNMKIRMNNSVISQWDITQRHKPYGVEYLLVFTSREMEIVR